MRLLQRWKCHVDGFAPDDFFRVEMEWILQNGRASQPDVKCSSRIGNVDEEFERDLLEELLIRVDEEAGG